MITPPGYDVAYTEHLQNNVHFKSLPVYYQVNLNYDKTADAAFDSRVFELSVCRERSQDSGFSQSKTVWKQCKAPFQNRKLITA